MDDTISRKAAIERATKDHDFYKGATTPADMARRDELLNVMCWLGELPSAQPETHDKRTETHACDCISRQAAIDAVLDRMDVKKYGRNAKPEEIRWTLEKLPSAQPGRKRGKWKIIMARHKYNGEYREMRQCSECHTAYFHYANQEDIEDEIPNFCPHCGAKMEVSQ